VTPIAAALTFPQIDPIAIAIGPFAIRWYALAYVAGLIGGWLYARRLVRNDALWGGQARPSLVDLDDLIVWAAIGVVAGGRIGYVLFYNPAYYAQEPLEALMVWRGGMSFHGGLVGALLATILFARRRALPVMGVLDLVATVAPVGLFFGRIANFINGELWGRPAYDFPYAVIFPGAGPVPRHPSQLYEAATEGLLLLILLALVVRAVGYRRPGLIAGLFAAGYAVARIGCEFFREPDPQLGFLFGTQGGAGLTMGMVLSLPLLVAGLWLILRARRTAPA
jgi:phosphatidylglycerol:prolipoprotein diacylglycerol transferase